MENCRRLRLRPAKGKTYHCNVNCYTLPFPACNFLQLLSVTTQSMRACSVICYTCPWLYDACSPCSRRHGDAVDINLNYLPLYAILPYNQLDSIAGPDVMSRHAIVSSLAKSAQIRVWLSFFLINCVAKVINSIGLRHFTKHSGSKTLSKSSLTTMSVRLHIAWKSRTQKWNLKNWKNIDEKFSGFETDSGSKRANTNTNISCHGRRSFLCYNFRRWARYCWLHRSSYCKACTARALCNTSPPEVIAFLPCADDNRHDSGHDTPTHERSTNDKKNSAMHSRRATRRRPIVTVTWRRPFVICRLNFSNCSKNDGILCFSKQICDEATMAHVPSVLWQSTDDR